MLRSRSAHTIRICNQLTINKQAHCCFTDELDFITATSLIIQRYCAVCMRARKNLVKIHDKIMNTVVELNLENYSV